MSFKREGNDSSLLSKLRLRRINELLGESIPADEAKLLSNGRFTCTVCNNVPIFDTVNMLVQHRQGKKHLANQHVHERKARELKELVAKRKHEQFLRNGTTSISMATSSTHGFLLSAPYNPRAKKAKIQPTEPKPRINLQACSTFESNLGHDSHAQTQSPHRQHIRDTSDQNLSNNQRPTSSSFIDIAGQQLSGPVVHDHQLKNLFKTKNYQEEPSISPYRCRRRSDRVTPSALNSNLTTTTIRQSVQPCPSPDQTRLVHPLPRTYTSRANCKKGDSSRYINNTAPINSDPAGANRLLTHSAKPSVQLPEPKISHNVTADSSRAQKLRQLQGSGWKRDWDGKWIKDEEAEFDSDEEPPDII